MPLMFVGGFCPHFAVLAIEALNDTMLKVVSDYICASDAPETIKKFN